MNQKKTFLWVAHESNISGANLALLEYIEACIDGIIKHVLVLPHEGNMRAKAEKLGITVIIISFYPWTRQKHEFFFHKKFLHFQVRNSIALYSLIKVIRKNNIQLVYTNTNTFNIAGWASKLSGRPHRWMIHEMGTEDFGYHFAWGKRSYHFMAWVSEKIFFNSNYVAEKYKKLLPKVDFQVMYYPVIVNRPMLEFTPQSKNDIISILIMGQLLPSKGQHDAIEALRIILENKVSAHLTIVGDSEIAEYKTQLEKKITEYNLSSKVTFKSFVENPNEEMQRHDLLLVCSKCEAFGRVTIEGMKLGLPVIASDTCGTKELVINRETGLVYKQGDAKSLAAAIETLINDESLQKKIILSANEFAERVCNMENVRQMLL